jgi:RNA polymerase sigma-70 factor (ECF subfamily)
VSSDPAQAEASRDAVEVQYSEWMQAAQSGDTDAYRQLLNAIQPKVRAIVRSKIQDRAAADDVVQNALLSIHRGRATYRPERPFGPWMRAVVRNSIIDHFRERKRRGDREAELPVEEWADQNESRSPEGDALAPELVAALSALPEGQREAVVLIQVEGLSVAEAALKADVSPGALKVRAHRGYRALRKMLEADRAGGEWRSAMPSEPAEPAELLDPEARSSARRKT